MNVASDLVNSIRQIQDLDTLQNILQQVANQADVIANQASNPNIAAARQYLEMQLAHSIATTNATQALLQNFFGVQAQSRFGVMQDSQAQQAAIFQALVQNPATNPLVATSLSNAVTLSTWNLPTGSARQNVLSTFGLVSAADSMVSSPLLRTTSDTASVTSFSFPHGEISSASTLVPSHISSPVQIEEDAKPKFLRFDGLGGKFLSQPSDTTSSWTPVPRKAFDPTEATPRYPTEPGYCLHGRQRSRCKDCGGSGICEHNKRRSMCKPCGGSQICPHKRQRSQCKDCGGTSICEHKLLRSRCMDCGGASTCEHKKRWSQCKDCGSSEVCAHKRRKALCKKCCNS